MAKSFNEKLIELLKTDSRFVDDEWELVKAAVIDRAWKIDRDLVKLLLGKSEIKGKFFDEIEGHWIFNINTFIEYVADKNFLANSYTRFRNKIGLNIDGKFLRERGEVSLVWPYKDCVLEGGQTKEEEKRKEIFFNEILAQDEIDRLFDPKVLTNWKRYTVAGEQKVTEIKRDEKGTIRENLIIKGNNLLALHTLKKEFRGKVKLIYIDPPYNTENDSFRYNDSFSRSTWLTFMKNRFQSCRDLLRQDGFLFVQIDNRELAYLKVLCDEVFGNNNFRNGIIVKKGQKSLQKQFEIIDRLNAGYDTILFYSKSNNIKIPNLFKILSGKKSSSWNNHWRGTDRPTMRFELFGITHQEGQWRWAKERTFKAVENYKTLISYIKRTGVVEDKITDNMIDEHYLKYIQENSILDYSDFELVRLSTNGKPEHYIPATNKILLSENWMDINVAGRESEFEHEKNEEINRRIIEWLTDYNDIILDFFAGSATTAAVAHKMNRQWITVEQMDYVETITVERLKKVIGEKRTKEDSLFEELEYDQGGISKAVNWKGGGDFIYCELMKYNKTFMDKIQAVKISEKLVELWKGIAENSFLNWYVNPEIPEQAVNDFIDIGKTENGLDKQKKLLVELLNKNQLYVNLSEIDDADFNVSDQDKKLNQSFYGENA
ncbi:MAG: site-specific DNA-methyltransferase [Thermodesulfobacteriota bacterium]|nr:site-specific DNA-methyltransferase [Thermodesulfobacteriota bacterium]